MPDLRNQPAPGPGQDASAAAPDPIRALHKMSTTAGLGTTDYVAINGAAVTAAILGLASALAIVADVFLVIPLAGVIFAVVALRQIANSNGTQGGRLLAWGGLVLSLVFAGIVIGREVQRTVGHRQDTAQLAGVIDQFSAAVKADNVDQAYALFHPEFQRRFDRERFGNVVRFLRRSQMYGELDFLRWNNVRFQFESVPGQSARYANGAMLAKFTEVREPLRIELIFRNDGDAWKIYNIPNFFSEKQ